MALEEGPYGLKRSYELPTREVSIIVTDEGFYPSKVSVFKGEKVKFFITSTSENKNCFILKGKDLFLSAEKGNVSEGVVFFDETARIEFYCPTSQEKGHLTVLERPGDKARRIQRELASEKVKVWMPKEE